MNKKIVAIGEVLIDIYGTDKKIGGAPFNFIYHINKLVGNSNLISSVGNDIDGRMSQQILNDNNINGQYIYIHRFKPTGKVLVTLSNKGEPKYYRKENVAYDFLKLIDNERKKIIEESDLFYFGTLAQRNHTTRKTIQSFYHRDLLIFCDLNLRLSFYTKNIILTSLGASNILKLNKNELDVVIKTCFGKESDMDQDIYKLISKFEIDTIAVTLGEEGASIYTKDKVICNRDSRNIEVIDTVGAGDAYSSILALGILHNIDIEHTNKVAISFASEVYNVKGALIKNDKIYDQYRGRLFNEK